MNKVHDAALVAFIFFFSSGDLEFLKLMQLLSIKDSVQSILSICCVHNNQRLSDMNIAEILYFSKFF